MEESADESANDGGMGVPPLRPKDSVGKRPTDG